jgi:hypothetical protein
MTNPMTILTCSLVAVENFNLSVLSGLRKESRPVPGATNLEVFLDPFDSSVRAVCFDSGDSEDRYWLAPDLVELSQHRMRLWGEWFPQSDTQGDIDCYRYYDGCGAVDNYLEYRGPGLPLEYLSPIERRHVERLEGEFFETYRARLVAHLEGTAEDYRKVLDPYHERIVGFEYQFGPDFDTSVRKRSIAWRTGTSEVVMLRDFKLMFRLKCDAGELPKTLDLNEAIVEHNPKSHALTAEYSTSA